MTPLLEARGLVKSFRRPGGVVRAVDGIDFVIEAGESVAIVGESGCGKTTLGRLLLRLYEPDAGELEHRGEDLLALAPAALRRRRRALQMVFQDAAGSLNPRLEVGEMLEQILVAHSIEPAGGVRRRVRELLASVGLPAEAAGRLPHEFSGGQKQRIGIARALAPEPDLLVADEPVSALDASVRAQILNLLLDLRERLGLAMVLVLHDLALVPQVAERIMVMYAGRVVESGPVTGVFERPAHPYTAALLAAAPRLRSSEPMRRALLVGEPPDPVDRPQGCSLHPRCSWADGVCATRDPNLTGIRAGRIAACHHADEHLRSGGNLGGRRT